MRLVKAFGRFWYDFVIGDDPKIAGFVAVALLVLIGLLRLDVLSDAVLAVLGGVLLLGAFTLALLLDVRRR
ncbi:MAG: hypothetical protein HOQ22_03170 [Nocardioidaceae bacterium]|nr:hypothetical protein [Nocardioidaceae bacterium]NUS50027.1 hypothetical protein [Nocardioidaceae bacterium]